MSAEDKISAVKIPVNRASKDGLVRLWVWNDSNNKSKGGSYKRVYPVDARELMAHADAAWMSPEDLSKSRESRTDDSAVAADADAAIDKTNAKELQKIIDENGLDVDLSKFEKLGEKRSAVQEALISKAKSGNENPNE